MAVEAGIDDDDDDDGDEILPTALLATAAGAVGAPSPSSFEASLCILLSAANPQKQR